MTMDHSAGGGLRAPGVADRKLPPVAVLCVTSMAMIIAGGIYIAAHLPQHVPLGPSTGLVIAAGAVLLVNAIVLSRVRDFSWRSFFLVAKWAGLAYLVISGMLEFIFAFDHTRGATLALVTVSLFIFAADIATLLAFSVARYQGASAS
jgi:hypothetical protein